MADSAKREMDFSETDKLTQKTKKTKADNENGRGEDEREAEPGNVLSGFQTTAVLSDSAREKNIFIHGKVFSDKLA